MSETATDVMHRTKGSLKLGGNPKDMLPKGLLNVMAEKGVTLPPELAGGNCFDFL
jgi:hypothetical protein